MSRIFNIDFKEGILGPYATESGGFHSFEIPNGGNATAVIENTEGRLGGYGLKIVSDSRVFDSNGLTSISGYDARPLGYANSGSDGDSVLMVDSHPARPKNGDNWWYSFSFKIGGTAWAKGRGYEPYIWQFKSFDENDGSNLDFINNLPLISLSIDSPGTAPYAISDWFRSTTTPRLFMNHIVPSTVGTAQIFFNNESNYSHADIGQLSFDTWYDVKLNISWSAYGLGYVKLWVKTELQTQFNEAPSYIGQHIQNIGRTNLALGQAFLKTGYEARLNNGTALNYMQNTLYYDNIIGGSSDEDVDLFITNTALPGKIIFDGGWDLALNTGTNTNSDQILAGDWIGVNIAPTGEITQGSAVVNARHAIAIENTVTKNSPYAARFEVRDGDVVDGFEQAEVYGGTITTTTGQVNKIPTNGGTAWLTWSSHITSTWQESLQRGSIFELKNADKTSTIAVGILQDQLYLQVNRFANDSGTAITTVYPWGIDISSLKDQWLDFKINLAMTPSDSAGFIKLWLNGEEQIMNYPYGTASWNGGYNTTQYTGKTLRPSGTSTTIGANVYPSYGLIRDQNVSDIWVVYHDNLKISYDDGVPAFIATNVIYPYDIASDFAVDTPDVGTSYTRSLGKAPSYKPLNPIFIESGTENSVLVTMNGLASWASLDLVAPSIPAGVIVEFGGTVAPTGWLLCDGSAVSRTTYADLFTAIGTTHGVGDGSTTFNVPDHRGRVAPGRDNMGGVAAGRLTAGGAGASGGLETHTLSVSEMPTHSHSGATGSGGDHSHGGTTGTGGSHQHNAPDGSGNFVYAGTGGSSANITSGGGGFNASTLTASAGSHNHTISASGTHTHTISSEGSGASHNNLQPYAVVDKIIKI